jgi:hypothetical protein
MTRIPRRSIAATKIETKESTPVRVADTPASGGHKNMKMKRLNASPEKNICRLHGFSKIVVRIKPTNVYFLAEAISSKGPLVFGGEILFVVLNPCYS